MRLRPKWPILPLWAVAALGLAGCGSSESELLQRGDSLAEAGDLRAAILVYDDAVRMAPGNPVAREKRGTVHLGVQHYREALADFDAVIALDPQNTSTRVQRGLAYLRVGEYPAAVADFSVVIARLPDSVEAYRRRGEAYLRMDRREKAIADLSRAAELDPDDTEALLLRGRAYCTGNAFHLAEADFTAAIRIQPNNAYAYWNRARVRESLGNKAEQAKEDRQRAIALDPSLDVSSSPLGEQAFFGLRDSGGDILGTVSIDPNLGKK